MRAAERRTERRNRIEPRYIDHKSAAAGEFVWDFSPELSAFVAGAERIRGFSWRTMRVWIRSMLAKFLATLSLIRHIHHPDDFSRFIELGNKLLKDFRDGADEILRNPTRS